MKEVDISRFRAKCSAWIAYVERTKKPIRITRWDKAVVEIRPCSPKTPDWVGSMKDRIEILGDIVSPAKEEKEWKALRD